ncbi:MAG: M15 family metallopeptidase [Deltaproteobacteria bacterium]|nr:M15 family metallopeptidase [Deltaproteobacteria bacterium]
MDFRRTPGQEASVHRPLGQRLVSVAIATAIAASACGKKDDEAIALTSAQVDASAAADGAKPAQPAASTSSSAATASSVPLAPAATALVMSSAPDPFGVARAAPRVYCSGVAGRHIAERDLKTSFVDGNDLLAIANRSPTGQLAPDWAPTDLVDLVSGQPRQASECDKVHCLRKEAASALSELMGEMKKRGFPGKVESAFRSYGTQCGTFLRWASKGGFCEATEQSALPGHSQHQLGTTLDLFTEEWAKDERGVFREGFGCTPAGRFLQEHATEYGFVMPYPIHPDDRHPKQSCVVRWDIPININPKTGYRFEHWHFRYVGKEVAGRFAKALAESGLGKPSELTLEQFLRAEKGITGPDAELPVCDGCNCGACSTLAAQGESSCDKKSGALHLDAHGRFVPPKDSPQIASAHRGHVKKWRGQIVEVKVTVPEGAATQPPIVGPDGAGYAAGSTFEKLSPYPETQPRGYAPLPNAWVVGVEPVPNDTGTPWPYRAALSPTVVGQIYDRANVLLPAHPGSITLKIPIPDGASKVRVVLIEGGVAKGEPIAVDLR